MNFIPWLIAAVAAIVAIVFLVWRARLGRELAAMRATPVGRVADAVAKAPGTLVAVTGPITSTAPIKGEFSGRECVYCHTLVEREYEEESRDSDGKRELRRQFETESSNETFAPSTLGDGSGTVAINFTGAKVEAVQVHRKYEAAIAGGIIGSLLGTPGATLGHRYTEWIIAPGTQVYVLGTVLASGGSIGAPPAKGSPFIVSIKSEAQRERSVRWTRLWLALAALVALVIAAAIVAWSLAKS